MAGFNIPKQIDYWRKGSREAMETAELLVDNEKLLFGLFFCHLAVEKLLKAHYVRTVEKLAPKTHDLEYLARNSGLELTGEQTDLLDFLMLYQLEGRYPENWSAPPKLQTVREILLKTKNLLQWLATKF